MQRSEYRAHRVGDDQANKTNDAAGGDARGREECGREVDQPPDSIHIRTQVMSRLIAECDQVQ
jgi:hypothetical protein